MRLPMEKDGNVSKGKDQVPEADFDESIPF
jgi:hypothetical protein